METKGKRTTATTREGNATVDELLARLHSHDWKLRERARWDLVALRERAVFPLADALRDPDWHVRWEAAKALHDIADPRAAPALVRALRDRRFGVRWLASDALIALREGALPALLDALVHNADSIYLREGAHHVLHDLTRGHLNGRVSETMRSVLSALEAIEAHVTVPLAARQALEALPKRTARRYPLQASRR
jgi:HEAT repeat protein